MEIEKLGQQLVARLKTACTAFFPQTMSNYIIANISYASLYWSTKVVPGLHGRLCRALAWLEKGGPEGSRYSGCEYGRQAC